MVPKKVDSDKINELSHKGKLYTSINPRFSIMLTADTAKLAPIKTNITDVTLKIFFVGILFMPTKIKYPANIAPINPIINANTISYIVRFEAINILLVYKKISIPSLKIEDATSKTNEVVNLEFFSKFCFVRFTDPKVKYINAIDDINISNEQ
jgi:hypothetical protein